MAGLSETLRDQRRRHAMDEIARVALDLFVKNGFGSTSVDDIAAAAGCAPRTFYRYFGSKEDVMFYDIPAMTQLLEEMLNGHLEHGLDEWDAVCETLVALIGRFDAVGEDVATERMKLWLNEPALSARYMQYITHAEDVVTNCLRAHRGTSAAEDDLSAIVAAAAIGAYRVTIFTHYRARAGWKLAQHLRDALAVVGEGVRTALTRASATNHRTPRRTGSKIKA